MKPLLDKMIKSLGTLNGTSIFFLKEAALTMSKLDLTTEQRDQYAMVFDNYGLPEFAELVRCAGLASSGAHMITIEDLEKLYLPAITKDDLAKVSEPALRGAHFVLKPVIVELKKQKLMTQDTLAKDLEVTPFILSRLLSGNTYMPVSTLTRIISLLPLTELAQDSLLTEVIRTELTISFGKTDRSVFLALAKSLQNVKLERSRAETI